MINPEPTAPAVLVTGASGTIGSRVVRELRHRRVRVRALVHRRTLDPDLSDTDSVQGDLADPLAVRRAVSGIHTVFVACANVPDQVEMECSLIDAAQAAGVRRVVKLSAQGAEIGSPVAFWDWHARIEAHLLRSGIPAAVLRPSFLMSNLFAAAPQLRHTGSLIAPAAAARITMIDPADVAASAVTALLDGRHDGRVHQLTGPVAVSYADVAAELSSAVGGRVGYLNVPGEAARQYLIGAGVPPFAADQVVRIFAQLRGGAQATPIDAVRQLTGRAPRRFSEFLADHVAAFTTPEPVRAPG